MEHLRLLGRTPDGPGQQVSDPLLQDRVGRQADGVADPLGLEQLVELGLGEGRIAAEIKNKASATIAGDHWHQGGAPAVGAMHVAGPEHAALEIAELVEHEQRVVARAAEVAVVGRALLLPKRRALRAIHVGDDAVRRSAPVHPVDPRAGQVRERGEIGLGWEPLGLEPAHLAGRSRRPVEPLPADDGAHGGVAGEPLGVVDVLVAGEPAVDGLPQQAEQPVADVRPAPTLGEGGCGRRGQAEGVVQLAVGEQAGVGSDPRPVEFELEAAVEGDPERLFRFTRRVRHPAPVMSLLCL
jgi:hypothetical protein